MKTNTKTAQIKSKSLKSKKKGLGSAPNMKAASNLTGYTFDMLSEAKNLGCSAFTLRGSVDCDAFIKWLQEDGQKAFREKWEEAGAIPAKETSQRIKEHYNARETKRRYEEKIRKMILRVDRVAQFQTFCEEVKAAVKAELDERDSFARACVRIQKAANIFLPQLEE